MNTYNIGDKIVLTEDCMMSSSKPLPKGTKGIVTKIQPSLNDKHGLLITVKFPKIELSVYSKRIKPWLEQEVKHLPDLEGYSNKQLKRIISMAQSKIDTEVIRLYSVTGRNWGKKLTSESKLVMEYTLTKGKISGMTTWEI